MKKILALFLVGFFVLFIGSKSTTSIDVPQDKPKIQKDTVKIKMSDEEKKYKEYMEYQMRQQKVNKNMETIDKQTMAMDSIIKATKQKK